MPYSVPTTMLRRLLPTLVGLLLGLLALGEGLFELARIFTAERDETRGQHITETRAIEDAATEGFRAELRRRLRAALPEIQASASDPLVPSEGLYLRFRGHQFLPRLVRASSRKSTPAADAYAEILRLESAPGTPSRFAERLARVKRGKSLTELWQFHSAHPLPFPDELAFMLRVVERFDLRPLLRGGFPEELGGTSRSAGLQRDLLRSRSQLSRADFQFLFDRINALSVRLGEQNDDFQARADEVPAGGVVLPDPLPEAAVLGGQWYFEPDDEAVRGVAFSIDRVLERLAAKMRDHGSLPPDARLGLAPHPPLVPLERTSLEVQVPAWEHQAAAIDQRYALKSSLLGVCGLLALGLAVLAVGAQERKLRFVELKGAFVATVSHELKTPLASIRLLAETLDRAEAHAETTRDYPRRIVGAADTLYALVENILTFNALGKGRRAVREGQVRLEELMLPLRRELDEAFGARARIHSGLGDTEVEGDAALLQLVFSNLARNACLYNTRTPIELRVHARMDTRGAVTVLFEDNGVGIPEQDRGRVFEDFVRAVPSGVEAPGSGLGLALCRRILKLHGGRIRIAQTGPAGTTFSLLFPPLR